MDVKAIFHKVKPLFEKYKNDEHIEFEIRVGKFNAGAFDTDVGAQGFNTILDGLRKYDGWERVVNTTEEVFIEKVIIFVSLSMRIHPKKRLLKRLVYTTKILRNWVTPRMISVSVFL